MTPAEIETLLQDAFAACDAVGHPLNAQQQEVLFRLLMDRIASATVTPASLQDHLLQEQSLQDHLLQDQSLQEHLLQEHLLQEQSVAYDAGEIPIRLQVGDRIEVSNGLWEWVQDDGPCSREWFPCMVITIAEVPDAALLSSTGYSRQTNCIIRFENGMEYEIQGIYEWNRYNWRWIGIDND